MPHKLHSYAKRFLLSWRRFWLVKALWLEFIDFNPEFFLVKEDCPFLRPQVIMRTRNDRAFLDAGRIRASLSVPSSSLLTTKHEVEDNSEDNRFGFRLESTLQSGAFAALNYHFSEHPQGSPHCWKSVHISLSSSGSFSGEVKISVSHSRPQAHRSSCKRIKDWNKKYRHCKY